MAGNIKVINPGRYYQQISRAIITDTRVDATTLGLFCKVIALSERWQLNIAGVAKITALSEAKVRAAFKTLEDCGYLKRERVNGEKGQFSGWDYVFYNIPTDIAENRMSENSDVGKNRPSENEGVYKEYISNTENKKIKKEKDITLPFSSFEFVSVWATLIAQPKWENKSADALRMSAEKLGKHTEADAIQMMKDSIANGWQGLFDTDKKQSRNNGQSAADRLNIGEKQYESSSI